MKIQEKIESLPKPIQNKVSGLLDILVHNYSVEKEVEEGQNLTLAMQLAEFILSTQDIDLLRKIESLIQKELDKQMTPRETEKTMENFN